MDRKKLAIIHIVKKELNLSDDEYRDILRTAAGVNSAKDLDEEKFKKLMNYFVRSRHWRTNTFGLTIRQKLYIQTLAQDIGWSRSHLNNFVQKYYHKSDVGRLSKEDAIKVIEALKNIKQHQK
ncbi:MAG: regulatory protein GemA [Candidatus Mariimomonas ferrooxydans]